MKKILLRILSIITLNEICSECGSHCYTEMVAPSCSGKVCPKCDIPRGKK